MFEKIPAPVKGQPARASWGAALTSRVNELCAMAPARGLARDGLTGTGFAALPSNRRERSVIVLPWSFSCTETDDPEKPGEKKRTGGWRNCRLQIGYNGWLVSPDLKTPDMLSGVAEIEGTDRTDDGSYVVEVDVSKDTAKIMLRSEISHLHPVDPEASVVYIDIGYVKDGVQKTRIPTNPVVYKYV